MSQVLNKSVTYSVTDVAVATNVETIVATSPPVTFEYDSVRVLIQAFIELTMGAALTNVRLRIRRGTGTGDPLVGESNALAIPAAAGSNMFQMIVVSEQLQGQGGAVYSVSVEQIAATTNGTVMQSCLTVEVLNG